MIVSIIFWLSLGILGYTYILYPVSLIILSSFKPKIKYNQEYLPTVSLIIAAYNEEHIIAKKIRNSLDLNYPKDKLEIIVFSDGSTDKTENIVKKLGIKLLSYPDHPGKTACQNQAIQEAKNEIIVFSDANSIYDKNAIKEIVKPLQYDKIGVSVGSLNYNEKDQESLYWKFEKFLKEKESQLNSILGANGAIYALKKNNYIPLRPELISDFIEPLKILIIKNKKTTYCPTAKAHEESTKSLKKDFKRKSRIILRSLNSLKEIKILFHPNKFPVLSYQLFWHKLMRWFSPIFLILLFLSNWYWQPSGGYQIFYKLQLCFYISGIIGINFKLPIIKTIAYFLTINTAALKAIINFIIGKQAITWTKQR